jgi:hypothetical protein
MTDMHKHDASASANASASGRPFESVKRDKQNLEDNTFSRDPFLGYRRSNKLSTRNMNKSFKGLSARRLSTASVTSEELLLDVFPSHVAKALMEGRKVEPESKECVTIFFSDIVGYTELGGSMEPHLVMNMLDRLYTKFDLLSEKYDVFKVETIGDAYMAVANLHKDQSTGKRLVFLFTINDLEISAKLNLEFRRILKLNTNMRQTSDHVHPFKKIDIFLKKNDIFYTCISSFARSRTKYEETCRSRTPDGLLCACGSGCSKENTDITRASRYGHRPHSRGLSLWACRCHCSRHEESEVLPLRRHCEYGVTHGDKLRGMQDTVFVVGGQLVACSVTGKSSREGRKGSQGKGAYAVLLG